MSSSWTTLDCPGARKIRVICGKSFCGQSLHQSAIQNSDAAAARRPVSPRRHKVVRKNRSAGVSPASEPRQLLLGQHDLCRLEAGDTFFLTTTRGHGDSVELRTADCPVREVVH